MNRQTIFWRVLMAECYFRVLGLHSSGVDERRCSYGTFTSIVPYQRIENHSHASFSCLDVRECFILSGLAQIATKYAL